VTELLSLVDYSDATGPTIDPVFAGLPDSSFWTATPSALSVGSGQAWIVNFDTGNAAITDATYAVDVLCVRGVPEPYTTATPGPAPAGRYAVPEAGLVYDTKTLLTWQAGPSGGELSMMDQASAASYCASLTVAAVSGWRLPTTGELLSLVDYSKGGGDLMIDGDYFAFAMTAWASTPAAGAPGNAWMVDYTSGTAYTDVVTDATNYVRCVR
jgi:hypothetical protein